MAIESICEGCGTHLRVADEHAGKQAQCPQCGRIYTVPATSQLVSTSPPPSDPSPRENERSPESSSDSEIQDAAVWYLQTPQGQVYGPVDRSQLNEWVRQGRVDADCQIRDSETSAWRPATSFYPQLAPIATTQNNPFRQNPYDSPQTATSRYLEPHRGVLILVFGILGFAICPIFGVIAWILASSDLKKMKQGTMDPDGRTMTQVGMVLGIIQVILLLLSFAWIVFAMIIFGM